MIFPTTNLDASAEFENKLAIQLATLRPDADLTRVDLTPFQPLKQKIDCITISWPSSITPSQMKATADTIGERLKLSRDWRKGGSIAAGCFITVQDPTINDLRFLIDNFPASRVTHLEIAIDAHLPTGSNELYLLRQLKEQIRHCIAPHTHPDAGQLKRKYFDLGCKRFLPDRPSHPAPLTTVIYEDKIAGHRLSIYLKTKDNGKPVPTPFLRTELRLDAGACEQAGMPTLGHFPNFVEILRSYCSTSFQIGCGFKYKDIDNIKWKKYGAAWVIKHPKGLRIKPDAGVNRAFGAALNELSRSLKRVGKNVPADSQDETISIGVISTSD